MRRLRDSILGLLIHLTILFNIERIDLDGPDVINLETGIYALTLLAIILVFTIKGLRNLSQPLSIGLWTAAYILTKVFLVPGRPLWGGLFTYLSLTELGLFLIAVFLAQRVALNIGEFEQAVKYFAFASNSKIKRVDEAQGESQAEIYRSRRFQRPLSLIVLEQDSSKIQTNINKVVQDAQRTLMEQYMSAMMARELSAQLRQTDILLEHDKTGRLVIVSPDTDDAGTDAFIERLKVLNRNGPFYINFGAATFPNHALTFEELLERAEVNLQHQSDVRISVDSSLDSTKEIKVG